ncbi:MAG: murein biosynthesis integral membrane protein MurJ [Gammaproteobacteria bacterium]|nr:murein biosynthesis integral membrane protein MurJ [Gammaproteobacteria bacterium]
MSKQLFKSTSVVAFMTFLSRILGLLRETVFASFFGASAEMDAFLIAFRIPNFMRRLFAEGCFSQAFIPVLSEVKSASDFHDMKRFIQNVTGTLGIIVLLVSIFGMVTAEGWTAVFAPGYWHEPLKFELATHLLRIMFPFIFFITITGLVGSILNVFGKFAIPAVTPVILNVCMIVAALGLSHYFKYGVEAAAWGVSFAGLVQLLFLLPYLHRIGLLAMPKWGWRHPGVQKIIKLMMPALFGASIAQISLLLDTIFASFLKTGSVSWLYYSDRVMQFPLGILGVALSTVVLPHLSRQHALKDFTEYNRALDWALRLVVILALPSALALAMLAGPILVTLFQYGKFTMYDVQMTEYSLWAFSFGLLFFIAVKIAVAAYYARQDMRTPVKIGIIAVSVNMILNAILIWPMAHAGLALATGIGSAVNTSLLLWGLYKQKIYVPRPGWGKVWLAAIVANMVMGAILYCMQDSLVMWHNWHALIRAMHLLVLIVVGSATYFTVLWVCGIRKHDLIL